MTRSRPVEKTRLSHPQLREATDAFIKAGSVVGAAKVLGIGRSAMQNRLDHAAQAGLSVPRPGEANPSRWRPGAEIVAARKAEFERAASARAGTGLNVIHLPDDTPFMVILFGDLHLDNSGTDLRLLEYWLSFLNREGRVTGIWMGDLLDNWVKPLQFLYAVSETTAPEGWILLEHYLDQAAPHLDASVGGNHDAWSGHSDLLGHMMAQRGILHRGTSLRFVYRAKSGREISVTLRHSWPGRSMWNEVHGIRRAARMGVRDTLLVGGHTHVSGDAIEKDPQTGRLTWCVQTAAFKTIDDYVDDLGLLDRQTSPAYAAVIDPRLSDADPELIKLFQDPERATRYLNMIRSA